MAKTEKIKVTKELADAIQLILHTSKGIEAEMFLNQIKKKP
ncbi:hypothetical protein WD019_02930 [Fictibacillus sp. Mic-4]